MAETTDPSKIVALAETLAPSMVTPAWPGPEETIPMIDGNQYDSLYHEYDLYKAITTEPKLIGQKQDTGNTQDKPTAREEKSIFSTITNLFDGKLLMGLAGGFLLHKCLTNGLPGDTSVPSGFKPVSINDLMGTGKLVSM